MDFLDLDLNLDVREARAFIQGLCALIITGTVFYHLYVYYGGLWGCIMFTILFGVCCYLSDGVAVQEHSTAIGRFVISTVILGFVVYLGGMEMTPVAIIMLAMLGTIEYIYKVCESLQERVHRLEEDVNFLYDENAAAEHDDDDDKED